MGSNLGWTAIHVEFERSDPKVAGDMRQIFYVRYIEYFITTPLLLAVLLLTSALPTPTLIYTLVMSEVAVVTRLVGALVKSTYKWGFYTFGLVAFFFVAYNIIFEGRSHARALGADINKAFTITGAWLIGLWLLYPIAWGVSEGGNVISPDSEAIFYGVIDILAKPVFGAAILWLHRNTDLSRLGLASTGVVDEKQATNAANTANDGATPQAV
jgi:bacteriorhodopsin